MWLLVYLSGSKNIFLPRPFEEAFLLSICRILIGSRFLRDSQENLPHRDIGLKWPYWKTNVYASYLELEGMKKIEEIP